MWYDFSGFSTLVLLIYEASKKKPVSVPTIRSYDWVYETVQVRENVFFESDVEEEVVHPLSRGTRRIVRAIGVNGIVLIAAYVVVRQWDSAISSAILDLYSVSQNCD